MRTPLPVAWIIAFVSVSLLVPALALAHPGHGRSGADGAWHYLREPVHVAIAVGAAVAVVGAIVLARRRSRE